ncbi:fibrous sheath-interacting protein 2 [Nycticebus coucang]|uniref:fibrous sheath-interacting protein 2 n=1 Tax=Nycticebus coucang TaxID=9470 RepID=UPI00234D14A4|nr:fibrous sheath-interacting protein 2 [Nycticebus coucang]
MELYLSACSKAANFANTKTTTSGPSTDSQQCGDGPHKAHFVGVGPAQLLDLPLGVKLPMIPGSDTVFFTTKLSEKLFRPSCGFNLTDPYCRLLENQYKSLHDPHLRAYYKRKDILRRLKKGGYVTRNNKIVCTLRELNKYRHYLTSLKLDFERNYVREQKMLAKQLHKLQENNQIPDCSDVAQLQNWLLMETPQSMKDQERLIRHRYLDMISKELEQLERTAEEQRLLLMNREERRQREHTRRKLNLRRKMEEEWKTKEMLLLTKIGEDVKREQKIEEQRRRSREESDRKKQALLEKKMAYHLQRMQDIGFKGEDVEKNTVKYKGQDGTQYDYSPKKKKKSSDDIKLVYSVPDQKSYRLTHFHHTANAVLQSQTSSKNVMKKSATSVFHQSDVQDNDTYQKRDGMTANKSNIFDDRGTVNMSAQNSVVSPKISSSRNFSKYIPSCTDPAKEEKDINTYWNGRPIKRSSYMCDPDSQVHAVAPGIFSSPVCSNIQQSFQRNCLQEKVTSEELNSIIQNIMTWVVATVTSILYPAITKYEERLQSNTYPLSDDSILSSDSSSFCSTCSEEFTYRSYTPEIARTFQPDPCAFTVDVSVKRTNTTLDPPSAYMERTAVGKTYSTKGQPISSKLKYNKTSFQCSHLKLRNSKSDSHLLASFETGTKISKDATTETDRTDSLGSSFFGDQKEKAMDEIKNLKNVFVNFKCYLKEETQLILESIFQEIMSDLTQAIPSLSSVTAEVFVDQNEPEKDDVLSNVDISSVASDIVENMLEKLESAVEKTYVEMYSQEDLPVDIKPSLKACEEPASSNEKPLKDSLPCSSEPMCDIAENMVQDILERLKTLASYKQNELPHPEDTAKLSYQQLTTEPTYIFLQREDSKKSSSEPDAANLAVKEEIQNLISKIFSQSSLVGYIEEAISTILGYVQTELNDETLIASEETVVLLQLFDDIFTQLHQEPENAGVQKSRQSRVKTTSDTEEKYRLAGTRLSNHAKPGRSFSPINVPGMALYSEDDNEEIDKMVKSVIDSSFKEEKTKSQKQIPKQQLTKGNTGFEHKTNIEPPTKSAPRSKVVFHDWELKSELPPLNNDGIVKKKVRLNKDVSFFGQDQKHQIQKASENIVKVVLTEMLKEVPSVPPGQLDNKGLSYQEGMDHMFSVSEINTVAQEITDAVLNILHKASGCISNTIKTSISSSVHQTSLNNFETHPTIKETPNKKPLKIWFDSEKKMKYLSVDPTDSSRVKFQGSDSQPVEDINDKIIDTIFKRLKLFVCPKLQRDFKTSLAKQSSLQSQLSSYTAKIVNIVLSAIQNELELSKENLNLREINHTKILPKEKRYFDDTDSKLKSVATNVNDDIMASPLLTCICEMLSSKNADQRNASLLSESTTSYGSENTDKQNTLPSRQDKKTVYKNLSTPCALHSVIDGKDLKENGKLQVLDRIAETLHEMLSKLTETHTHSQPSCSHQNREKINGNQQTAASKSNIHLISKAILEYILAKLCCIDMDTSCANSGLKALSESLDIDKLSFTSIIEEMGKCTDIISSIVSIMIQEDNKEATKSNANIAPVSSKTERTKETHPNKLKAAASDIVNMVFAELEGFASGNLGTKDAVNEENEKIGKMDWEYENTSIFTDTNVESLQSALYMHAKKISNAILKAIQTELNENSSDSKRGVKNPPPEAQIFKDIVNLVLDAVSSTIINETESAECGIEDYHYRPTYGNFLPGGAESDSFLEDDAHTEKILIRQTSQLRGENKTRSLEQWVLERALNEIEVKLKEPHKSPVAPIIRNILKEIFQNALISQLSVLSLSHSPFSGMSHNVDEPIAQTSVPFIDKMMGPFVSEGDVTIVTDNIVRTVFHKLYLAAMKGRNVSKNKYKSITFSANDSFPEHTYKRKSSVTLLDRNPHILQSRFSVDKQTKVNVVEDIVQAILTNLETFATSKVTSLFFPQENFTVPMPLSIEENKTTSRKALLAKDSYSDEQSSCSSVDHIKLGNTNFCQLPSSKLNSYATEVARKILQGIKHELDKERKNPFSTPNIVVSDSIASQIVNTVLDIVSLKSKCDRNSDKNNSDKKLDSGQQEGIIETLFNKTEYRKVLQFQIQDTIEGILCDIYEKTVYQNNLSYATPTLKCSTASKHSEANSEMFIESANKIIPKLSVPKSDVILISNDIVNLVLHNLSTSLMLVMNAKTSPSARLPLTFCDTFPQTECQDFHLKASKSERKTVSFPCSRNQKSSYADDNQKTVVKKEDIKKSALDLCEESVNFIAKTVFNHLESFATERIDSLITFAFQPNEKSFVSTELGNCKQDQSIFHESSQVESNVNVCRLSTAETILSQELTDSAFASDRKKAGSIIHVSQAILKKYANIIASATLKLIKNDLDLEIQKIYPYSDNILFQENTIVSEIINTMLKILDRRSVKEIGFYSKENPNFSQLTESNAISLQKEGKQKEGKTKQSVFTKNQLEQNQMISAKKTQRIVLEEIFMRNKDSKQKENNELLTIVEEHLNKLYQRVMEVIGHLPPPNEISNFTSNSKVKTSGITQKVFQAHINTVANDIVESVLGKMYSVVVTSIYENNKRKETEMTDNKDPSLLKPSRCRETKQAGERSNSPRYAVSQVRSYADNQNVSVLEKLFLQYSPSQVEKDLVQIVLDKITNFVSHYLDENLASEICSDETHLLRLPVSKDSPKNSPKPSFKTSLKPRSKGSSLPKVTIKPHLGPNGAKAKSKTKLGPGEKITKDSQSKTATGLPNVQPTGDAKNLLETKLPTSELKMFAKDIISNILEAVVKEFEKVKKNRAMVNMKALPSDQIVAANKIVNMVLQELHVTKKHPLDYPLKFSHLDDLKLSQGNIGSETLTNQACFYLENVSSQLEQIFPKEGIFKKMFDKWQTESNDMENDKCKLLTIAENVLTEISIKAKELEYSLSLLNLPPLENCESRFYHRLKGASARAEDTKAQINMFGREIVEMLFEKLQLCFLAQLPTPDYKEIPANTKEHISAKSKYGFPCKQIPSSLPFSTTRTKDKFSVSSSNQIVQDIIERVLNILESFVDLKFKHISKYEFSEIVKMPIENLFPVQQRLLSKKMLPRLQSLKILSDESKLSTISKENIQNTLLQVHSFHSELLIYAVSIVSDMLGMIKNKLDKEISQMEPSSISILKENFVASDIIGTLMDQCTHFNESLIKNLAQENLLQGAENAYIVNQVRFETHMKMPTSKLKETSLGNKSPQMSVPGLVFYSEEDREKKCKISSNLPSYVRSAVDDTIKSLEPVERPDSEATPSYSVHKVQDHSPRKPNFGYFDEVVTGNSFLPEGSVLQKLFKKANDSTETALKQVMSFMEIGKSENPRVFHYETLKEVVDPNQIQTTVPPLKICLAAENIVNTVLSSYGIPSQPHTNESEAMKPFFISKQSPFSEVCGGQKNEENSLLRMWHRRISCVPEEENNNPEVSRIDSSLLHKWHKNKYPKKTESLNEIEIIAFADHELGLSEIHSIARHVTTSVVTHLKNFRTKVSSEEKVSIISTLSRKKYESKQPQKSTYNDALIYQFCEHLTESVIYHLISSISDGTKEREKEKVSEIQEAAFNKILSVHSQVFESRSISIGELALNISEIIIKILCNSNIIKADNVQQICSIKTNFIYCPGVASADFDNLFQDLSIGVIHVLSKEIGINQHFENNRGNKLCSMVRNNSVSICDKTNTVETETGPRDWQSSIQQMEQLVQKKKLKHLAHKLDNLVGNLKTNESKEVVNKVFNIVLDLFLPDECPDRATDSGETARTFFSSPKNQQNNSILTNNLGLSPKSVFLLNIVCEKLIRILLEKCTNAVSLDNDPISKEIPAEERQLLKILQNVEDGKFDFLKRATDCEKLHGNYMPDPLENMEEIDQDLLSSDSVLTVISHSLVKSLMDKLVHSIQQTPESPPFTNEHLNCRTREIQSSFTKTKRSELIESGQSQGSLGFVSYDSNSLRESLNNTSVVGSKMKAPFCKKSKVKSSSVSPLKKHGTKKMDTVGIHNKLHQGGVNTGVYSATFLEEIISELFSNLSTSLWCKNKNITEARLYEMNTLFINNVVNEFNNIPVPVLRYAEERLCFPPVPKETVSKIVDSVYYDVLQQYETKVTCSNNLSYDNTSLAEEITNGILLEILDYQLPSSCRAQLMPHSYYPLQAEIILQKLQNNLREFISLPKSSAGYRTMLSHSFLEDVVRKILSQLISPPHKASFFRKQYLPSVDFNEMSTRITNKVMSAISKHKIWFTIYDNQDLCTGTNLQKMVDAVYTNILQMSDSLASVQRSIISRSPMIVDRIASFIIQEIIENHLQPFLCGELLPRPRTPLDAVSNMVKQVLSEVIESDRPQKPLPLGVYPDTFVGEIVARLLSKIFNPKHNTAVELQGMTKKIVNSINNHFDEAKIHIPRDDKEQCFPSANTDIIDELVTLVYGNVLKQYGLDPDIDKEPEDTDNFVENITNLIIATISDYLLHPLFSGDLSASSYSISVAETIVQEILSNISKSIKSSQSLPLYNTLLPYTFLEDMIRVLLSKFFPSASSMVPNKETPKHRTKLNFNEIASNLISDIRMKISQHEIRFSKDEEETKFVYSEDDVQHLVDSVFKNILQNSESQESVEQSITSSSDSLIDKIAGFIIKYICQQHLQPFVDGKALSSSSYTCFGDERRQLFYGSVYSSTFLEDVVSGVLSKIFHRVVGIVQTKSVRDSEDELFDKAEKLIHFITEEFSKAQVSVLDNAEEQFCLPPVERDVVNKTIDMVYSKILQEYEMKIMPNKDFLNDPKTLAERVTKIILSEIIIFQIHPNLIAKLPFRSHSKLNANVLINKVQHSISKSRFRRQASTIYTTMLSHTHLEKIITQLVSKMSPLASGEEHLGISQSDLSNTVIKLINEIMSIISKHAICIVKHGNEKQSMISEKTIQSMVDSIYADLSHSNLYQSLTKDKKGISNIPVSQVASFIIKEIFNHHLQSFVSGDKSLLSAAVDQTYQPTAVDSKQRELSLIVNSAVFLEEVISELLCKILYAFSHNVSAAENPDRAKAKITEIVTTLVNFIVTEFTTSEIFVADNLDKNLCFSEKYKEMVQKTVYSIYEKILDEYKSLINIYRVIQSDTLCFGRKIYHLLLEEIYDYQVQSLVSGELESSSYSSPQADNIITRVLNVIMKDSHALPSCMTVLPRSLLEDMIYKLLLHIFPSAHNENDLQEEDVPTDYEFEDAASNLTEEIIKEISEHEIRLSMEEDNAESTPLEAVENLVDSICNNILKKSEFQDEVQKSEDTNGDSFLSKIAGFIMKEIMDHHLQPFLHGEESSFSDKDHVSEPSKSAKEKTQPSLYSATFLEDVIVDLVHKFCSLPIISEDSKDKETPELDTVGLAVKFANSLIGEFKKSKIKVLPNAEKLFSFPPIEKETVDKISDFVYDQFIGKCESNGVQKNDKNDMFIEMICDLAQKAISAFKIQPLFSGDWSSIFFSFLNPENITQRVQHLPRNTSTQVISCLKGNELTLPQQSYKSTSLTSDQKNMTDTLEINKGTMSRKQSSKTKTISMKKDDIQNPILTSITAIMKSNMFNLMSGSAADTTNKKKEDKNKMGSSSQKYSENVSKVSSPTSSMKKKDPVETDWSEKLKNDEMDKKRKLAPEDKEDQGDDVHTHFSVDFDDLEYEREVLESDFKKDNDKIIDNTRERSFKQDKKSFQASSLESQEKNIETPKVKSLEIVSQKSSNEDKREFAVQTDMHEVQYSDYEHVQNVIENIYDDVLVLSYQEPSDISKLRYNKSPSHDKALNVIQEASKDLVEPVTVENLSFSTNTNVPFKEKDEREEERVREKEAEKEKVKEKEIQSKPSIQDFPQNSPESKPGIFPAKLLEDVITELVNKLIFSSLPETQAHDRCQNINDDENQAELYDTAMKLIDSLLKEFSDAQIKVFRPDKGNQHSPPVGKESSVSKMPSSYKEPSTDKTSPSIMTKTEDKLPCPHKMSKISSSDKISSIDKIPSVDKSFVNKVVHSSVCSILKEYKSQDSICKNINSDGENLARQLSSAVINEIFQHQLNLIFCDDIPVSACLPLESKDVFKKVQRVAKTASKECQTSSPYTIMLPHKFLDNVISALLSKFFSRISSTKAKHFERYLFTELDVLHMKLVSTVAAHISKNEDMTIQYVEPLQSNDDEIIQLVAQSIYNNLLPQFGSEEIIQNCITSGCKILSETIVDLVLQEVASNQMQNYFCGDLTPNQCAEVESVVENILKEVIRTPNIPPHESSHAPKLSYNIVEAIAVKFLSKLLSVFPNMHKERSKSPETEMQKISSKILNSVQEFISKSKIKLVAAAKEPPTVPLADNAVIDKVVNSVYTSVLTHSGSLASVFKDLMGQSNALSDIIGFLMVKEISNSKFQPQVEEDVSSTELVLEAVKIMEKVVKIIDKFNFQEKSPCRKDSTLDARFLEETLALFLAKLVKLPGISTEDEKNLPQPELNKIASQLTKSVTAEISRSNISLVADDSKKQVLNTENIEMISHVVDSVYSDVLQQSGTPKELYNDIRNTNTVFPKKVASLLVDRVSSFSSDTVSSKNLTADNSGKLDINRIVQKARTHSDDTISDLDKEESDQDLPEEKFSAEIVPHVGKKPIKIDPRIVSEHLAVISVKTQPLEKLKMECLKNTGHSIAELRRASITGRNYSDTSYSVERKRERRTSLDRTGRLDVKPLEAVCRNSFQNIRKPDISKVELLKDVQGKKDLIIRLVAHDIDQVNAEDYIEEEANSEEEEVILGEVFAQDQFINHVKKVNKPVESKVSPKPTPSTNSLKKFLSLSKCCHISSENIESIEPISNQIIESNETNVKRAVAELDMATTKMMPETVSSWEKKPQYKKEEKNLVTEPTHYYIHRIMSLSSYNQDDLLSSMSDFEEYKTDGRAKILEENSQKQNLEHANSVKFITIFEGSKDVLGSASSSKEAISETPKPSISKQGSKMLAKVSSALSKVFSRSNPTISKSSSQPHQDEH